MPKTEFNEVGKYGIVRDIEPMYLPAGAWSEGRNIRFRDGMVVGRRNAARLIDPISIKPHFMMPWQDPTRGLIPYYIYADNNSIYEIDDSAVPVEQDISKSGGYDVGFDAYYWTGTVFSGIPILSSRMTL